jgi:ParB family transcriptional regulator, chromosome partitioning protein
MPTVLTVGIDRISIGRNRRPVKDEKIMELMQSIKANGLLNPITVDQKLHLIAGLHRLTACKMLGLNEIECNIVNYDDADQARLAEIDENFIRNELEPLERYELWLERDRILARMGLRFKPGDNQHTCKGGGESISPPITTLEQAKASGYSKRTFQQGKQIAKDIHPEVKQKIIGTPLAKSTTTQLKIARTGCQERDAAEAAEKAFEVAMLKGDKPEAQRQALLARQAREQQKQQQMQAFENAIAKNTSNERCNNKKTKSIGEKLLSKIKPANNILTVKSSEEWILERHLVYRGNTAGHEFINLLPSNASLAIAISPTWEHDYLVSEARVVAVLCAEGHIYNFCSRHQMPFKYEFVFNNFYVGIFSYHSIPKPDNTINLESIEGIITYLINLYTNPNSFVIAPFMGQGEVLIACERLGRICFVGDENPDLINGGIRSWQNLTNKQARKSI